MSEQEPAANELDDEGDRGSDAGEDTQILRLMHARRDTDGRVGERDYQRIIVEVLRGAAKRFVSTRRSAAKRSSLVTALLVQKENGRFRVSERGLALLGLESAAMSAEISEEMLAQIEKVAASGYPRPVGELTAASSEWDRLVLLTWCTGGQPLFHYRDLTDGRARFVGLPNRFALHAAIGHAVERGEVELRGVAENEVYEFGPRILAAAFPKPEAAPDTPEEAPAERVVLFRGLEARQSLGDIEAVLDMLADLGDEEADIHQEMSDLRGVIAVARATIFHLLKPVKEFVKPKLWRSIEREYGAVRGVEPNLSDAVLGLKLLEQEYHERLDELRGLTERLRHIARTRGSLKHRLAACVQTSFAEKTDGESS